MSDLDLDAIKTRLKKATPGPWEAGDRYHCAYVMPRRFGEGRCVYCDNMPLLNADGRYHVHTTAEPWWEYGIKALTDGVPCDVVVEVTEYGTMRRADREFIANAPADIAALVAEVERLRRDLASWQRWVEGGEWPLATRVKVVNDGSAR